MANDIERNSEDWQNTEQLEELDEENYIARKVAKSDAEEEASAKLEAELI